MTTSQEKVIILFEEAGKILDSLQLEDTVQNRNLIANWIFAYDTARARNRAEELFGNVSEEFTIIDEDEDEDI